MLQFVRQTPIQIVFEKALSERRGFLFHLAAGFSKNVDPLSGMTVNLVVVDQWLRDLKSDLEGTLFRTETESLNHGFAELMGVLRLNLAERAETEKAKLASLTLREERGWSLSWNSSLSPEEMIVTRSHYIEQFAQDQFELIQLKFNWLRVAGCEADYGHEGFLLLKHSQVQSAEIFMQNLKQFLGHTLTSGSFLKSIEVTHPEAKYSVVLTP